MAAQILTEKYQKNLLRRINQFFVKENPIESMSGDTDETCAEQEPGETDCLRSVTGC